MRSDASEAIFVEGIKAVVERCCRPEDVFTSDQLNTWAETHGYVKEEKEE